MKIRYTLLLLVLFAFLATPLHADWRALHGNPQHTGYIDASLKPPFGLVWVRHFMGERLGTAMEPIVADGKVFVATHNGSLYALNAETGDALWRFHAPGFFLHSPAYANDRVVAASTDGHVYALDAASGKTAWSVPVGVGGCSVSPLMADNTVFIGTRAGDFLALELATGKVLWKHSLGVPVRQTAAFDDGKVFVTPEDLRVRCFDAKSGKLDWTSAPLAGQTARDYYPIIVKAGGRKLVIVRTNPLINMGQRIARDRTLICRDAGVDDSDWRKTDAYIKSDKTRGTPELWDREQRAIESYLKEHREAPSFFVLDASSGKEALTAPVLWVAGCQAVGAEPALTADGRLLVFYRSVFGNWNHGVAPLVTLGLYDLQQNRITPLFHQGGKQPPWNTFWGTADESQNFVVAGDTVLIVHQGTLSAFDLKSGRISKIHGERDTFGGFRSPPWARNEWHGPGRGGVAVVGNRIYWQTGSRILCLQSGAQGKPAEDVPILARAMQPQTSPAKTLVPAQPARELAATVREVLQKNWAPLFVDPGLAGRDFSFDDSGELFEALAWAYPHLPADLQQQARTKLLAEWQSRPPFTKEAWYSLKDGERREYFWTPDEVYARFGGDKQPQPFANVYSAWLFAERCDAWKTVLDAWPRISAAFQDFEKSKWQLDRAKGDLYANRYLASLMALERIATKAGDTAVADRVKALSAKTTDALLALWQRAGAAGTLTNFSGSAQLDPFINAGDAISFKVAPHRHKLALFSGLTPEIAAVLHAKAPEAVERVLRVFNTMYLTWPCTGEERQVHFGENFVDPPDLALNGFMATAWLQKASKEELATRVDLPFCRADLYHLTKLALLLEP